MSTPSPDRAEQARNPEQLRQKIAALRRNPVGLIDRLNDEVMADITDLLKRIKNSRISPGVVVNGQYFHHCQISGPINPSGEAPRTTPPAPSAPPDRPKDEPDKPIPPAPPSTSCEKNREPEASKPREADRPVVASSGGNPERKPDLEEADRVSVLTVPTVDEEGKKDTLGPEATSSLVTLRQQKASRQLEDEKHQQDIESLLEDIRVLPHLQGFYEQLDHRDKRADLLQRMSVVFEERAIGGISSPSTLADFAAFLKTLGSEDLTILRSALEKVREEGVMVRFDFEAIDAERRSLLDASDIRFYSKQQLKQFRMDAVDAIKESAGITKLDELPSFGEGTGLRDDLVLRGFFSGMVPENADYEVLTANVLVLQKALQKNIINPSKLNGFTPGKSLVFYIRKNRHIFALQQSEKGPPLCLNPEH